jgi:membrane dipeptidase
MGRDLVKEIDRLGIVHDVSHLSDRALDELFSLTQRPVIASHSNCRSLLGDPANQRHLTDRAIREITRRGGVIGLNLYTKFLNAATNDAGRCSIDDALAHVEHICEIAQSRAHVGLGTDMDGGFAANRMPDGMNRPTDLQRLIDGLQTRGWSEPDIDGFMHANFVRIFSTQKT